MKEYTQNTITNKNCFIYVRVSTTTQSELGYSLDAQVKTCTEYAHKLGFAIKDIFRDEGESATAANRPEFLEMIDRCENGEVGVVIVYLTDRFARNETDHYLIKDKLKKCGVELYSANQEMRNGDTPEAYLVDGIMASINAFYSRDNSRKTKKGMVQKFEEGYYPSWAPQGYKHIIDELTEKHAIAIDETIAPLVKKAFELFASGAYSLSGLCEKMDEFGLKGRLGKKLCESSLQQMLTNTFYWGLMRWGGREKIGKHVPIIEKVLYDKVQYMLAKHRSFLLRERKYDFLLRGLVRCEVHDRRLVADWHNAHSSKLDKVGYYHCCANAGCAGSYFHIGTLENAISELFKNLQFKPEFISLVIEEAKKHLSDIQNNSESKKLGITNKINSLEQKRNKLESLLVEGTVNKDIFNRQHALIQNSIDVLYRQMIDLERDRGIDIKFVEEILYLAKNIYTNYLSVSPQLKRRYILLFFENIYVKDKKISKVFYRPLFKALLDEQTEVLLRANWLPRLGSDQ